MKRPSFQFYTADWQGNSNLKRCTHEEKGIWIDIMCLMHDQEEYGILRWSIKEIALAVNTSFQKIKGLIDKKILKGASAGSKCEPYIYIPRSGRKDGEPVVLIPEQEGEIWYSSRMVKDEYVRKHAGANTRFKAKDDTKPDKEPSPESSPTHRQGENEGEYKDDNQGDGSSTSSSSSKESKKEGGGDPSPIPLIPLPALPPSGWLEDFQKIKGWNEPSAKACWDKFVENNIGKTKTLVAWKLAWTQWWSRENSHEDIGKGNSKKTHQEPKKSKVATL